MRALIALLLWWTSCVAAEEASVPLTEKDCPTVDLSEKFGPIRNQGKIGNCFAHSVADLIGYTAGITPHNQVSAIDVQMGLYSATEDQIRSALNKQSIFATVRFGLKYLPGMMQEMADHKASSNYFGTFDGGNPWLAAMAYNTRAGICTEAQLPSTGPQAMVSSDFFVRDQISKFAFTEPIHTDFLRSHYWSMPYEGSLYFPKKQVEIPCTPKVNPLRRNAEYLDGVVKQTYKKMDASLEKFCTPRKPVAPILSVIRSFKEDGARKAAKLLSYKPPLPFVWSYDSRFLNKGVEGAGQKKVDGGHGSVVVGMRWDGKQCQFKVRNSWGINCESYHESLRAACKGGVLEVPAEVFEKYSHDALVMTLDEKASPQN